VSGGLVLGRISRRHHGVVRRYMWSC
jgi:hypothetical protein